MSDVLGRLQLLTQCHWSFTRFSSAKETVLEYDLLLLADLEKGIHRHPSAAYRSSTHTQPALHSRVVEFTSHDH
jgi:hypothetical protein